MIGVEVIKENAENFTNTVSDLITTYCDKGMNLSVIADELNKLDVTTARGGKIRYASTVSNQIKRIENKSILIKELF